jgi:histone acetyltransferase
MVVQGLGLTDYSYLIKNPMDLGTVSQKFSNDKYMLVEEVLDDIQLIWDNCKLYNPPASVTIEISAVDL